MSRTRLSRTLLRQNLLPLSSPSHSRSLEDLLAGVEPSISRRRMLGLSGFAVLGAAPVLKGAGVAMKGEFSMVGDRKRLAFHLGGKERWVIEPERFGGRPELSIDQNDKRIRLELRNAWWPGTELPADFRCEILRGIRGSRITFDSDLFGRSVKGAFEKFLLDLEPLRANTSLDRSVARLGKTGELSLRGAAELSFRPDWSLKVDGTTIARIDGLPGERLLADRIAFALPAVDLPALLESPDPLRTLITIPRGQQVWNLQPELRSAEEWNLNVQTNAFERIVIETGEKPGGLTRRKSSAMMADGTNGISFIPAGSLTQGDGDPFHLPLESPRYAVEFGERANNTMLVADYPATGVTMRTSGLAVKLGKGETDRGFELTSEAGILSTFDCSPAILSASLPLRGAIVQGAKPRTETPLRFFPKGRPDPQKDENRLNALPPDGDEGEVELDEEKETVVTFPLNSVIWVLRPADMLYLGFEFINLKVQTGSGSKGKTKGYAAPTNNLKEVQTTGSITMITSEPLAKQISQVKGPAYLSATGSGGASKPYLVVHFPPQNIAEQAYWETEPPSAGIDQEKPANMKPPSGGVDSNGNEIEDLPPIKHRIAGPSRLAFALPSGMTQLPYTLADLLDWSSLTPSVVPSALPPPPPPSPSLGSILGLSDALQGKISNQYNGIGLKGSKGVAARLRTQTDGSIRIGDGSVKVTNGGINKTTIRSGDGSVRSGDGSVRSGDGSVRKGDGSVRSEEKVRTGIVAMKRSYSGTTGHGGLTTAITAKSAMMASDPSIQANPEQMKILVTENPVDKINLYLDLKAITPEIIKPKPYHTAIEAPYRLILSPHVYAGWAHALAPVTHNGRTELWHTRLGVRKSSGAIDERDDYYRTIRAVWSPDYAADPELGPDPNNLPFRMSLNGRDRNELVHLSANFKYPKGTSYTPDTIDVEQLMLSPLGAWMNVRGSWEPPAGLSIEEWKHRGTMGRDHYVRVVYKGFLFPFGHRASLVKITERKIRKHGGNGYIAYMYQRMYIVVRKPVKEYPGLSQPYDGRRTPFRRVTLTTLMTPNLDRPEDSPSRISPGYGDEAFWPAVDKKDFLFNIVADDWEGNQVEFSTPLAFINNTRAFDYGVTTNVLASYNDDRSTRETFGQTVAYAPSDKPGDTAFETDYVKFTVDVPTSSPTSTANPGSLPKVSAGTGSNNNMNNDDLYGADQPYFYPAFQQTRVRIDAVEQITGTEAFREIQLHDTYYKYGIESSQNKGQVFAKLMEEVEMSFNTNADKAGGLVTPNLNIAGLSRSLGTVGGKIEEVTSGKFDPTSFFDEALNANLLGGISLRDIIDAVNDFAGDLIKIPRMLNSKDFTNPKELLNNLNALQSAVNDVKNDIDKFKEMKDDIDAAISDIEDLPDEIGDKVEDAVKDAAEKARQKALAVIQQIEKEAKGVIDQAKGYAESVINKVKQITESESLADLLSALGLPTEFKLELKWGPTIKSWPNSSQPNDLMGTNALFQTLNAQGQPVEVSDEVLYIRAALKVKLDGSAPEFLLEGVANNFVIRLVPIKDVADEGFVHLRLTDLSFRSENASKMEVNVEFDPDEGFKFAGPLAFIEKIREFIPFDGFSDPPSLDISPTGITAGFTFPIPTIAVGVFSLQNISLGASLELPFTNSPIIFTFLFCTRENPFILTVSMFGGGGFFGLIISTREIGIEAALEFGANIAFDIGVASGGVYIMAGVYYKKMGEECILEGYLKLGGHLSVLGIVSVSIDLYMSLTYKEPGGKVVGQATITIEVEVFFFSISISKTFERRFKGSENDPLFIDLMSQDNWTEYCQAFAAS